MRKYSVESLCEAIWKIEAELNLCDANSKIVWSYMRMAIYYKLSIALSVFQEPHHVPVKRSIFDKLKIIFRIIFYSFVKNPFVMGKKADVCFLEHERCVDVNGQKVDIYSLNERERLVGDGKSVLSLEKPYALEHLKTDKLNSRLFIDFILLVGRISCRFHRFFVSTSSKQTIKKISQRFASEFEVDFDIESILSSMHLKFVVQKALYKFMLRRIKPRELIVVVAYGNNDLICAAQDLGIPVTELQHGIISKFHLGYSYPNVSSVHGFPNVIRLWEERWNLGACIPLDEYRIRYDLTSPFHENLTQYKNLSKIENRLIVLSQGAISDQIVDELLFNIDKLCRYDIYYKLHPSEFKRWKRNPKLVELHKKNNFHVVDKCNLYELLATSLNVVGVFSTALLEAKSLGCNVYIMNLPGSEYFENVPGYKNFSDFCIS